MSEETEKFFRAEYRESQDLEGCYCIVPTVWMGVQGFDLKEQYADEPMSAQEKAEWFVSMFKKAIDNYAKKELERKLGNEKKYTSLDLLELVRSEEFKNKEFIYEQHEMIAKIIGEPFDIKKNK